MKDSLSKVGLIRKTLTRIVNHAVIMRNEEEEKEEM